MPVCAWPVLQCTWPPHRQNLGFPHSLPTAAASFLLLPQTHWWTKATSPNQLPPTHPPHPFPFLHPYLLGHVCASPRAPSPPFPPTTHANLPPNTSLPSPLHRALLCLLPPSLAASLPCARDPLRCLVGQPSSSCPGPRVLPLCPSAWALSAREGKDGPRGGALPQPLHIPPGPHLSYPRVSTHPLTHPQHPGHSATTHQSPP